MTLRISPDLSLPLDAVTQAMAILARRGAGKTYTASVLVEEVVKARQPVVVLDPTGAWWGLRSSADGEHPGLPVVILGGEHGDVPLEPTAGRVIADVVIDHPGAYVIDLSGFESKAAEHRFAADFLERLYRAKATKRDALLVVVDEADGFAPQRPGPGQERTLGALEAIVRRGRIRGLGCLLITQRAAVLNKNVLTQTEVLIVMQTTGPQDRAAIDEWIKGNGTPDEREQVLGSLASLAQGEAWVWSPAWLRTLVRIRIRRRETFDSSKTPEAGERAIAPRSFATVDLATLGAQIAATVERAKADDPKALRARIRELERQLAERPTETTVETVTERVEVPVLPEGIRQQLAEMHAAFEEAARRVAAMTEARAVLAGTRTPETAVRAIASRARTVTPVHATSLPPVNPAPVRLPTNGDVRLGKAEMTFLGALTQHPGGLSPARLSLITGYSAKSGHFANVLGKLRAAGYVDRGQPIRVTPEGRATAGDVEVLPVPGTELVDYWLGRLGKAERAMLEVFVEVYPQPIAKDDLSTRTGYSATSGHFANVLGRLRGLGLVDGFAASRDLMEVS